MASITPRASSTTRGADGVEILIESDAGSGTKLGGEFEHLAGIIERTETDIGICIDTAHTLVAGNDLTTPEAVDETVGRFDDVVGLEYLEYIHLNDSKHDVGTHKDEHAHIGEGTSVRTVWRRS